MTHSALAELLAQGVSLSRVTEYTCHSYKCVTPHIGTHPEIASALSVLARYIKAFMYIYSDATRQSMIRAFM